MPRPNRRRVQSAAVPNPRPGAAGKKSLAKALGPQGAKAAKAARQAARNGNHGRAARMFEELGERLQGEGRPLLAARALLHCAANLHKAGNTDAAHKAVNTAVTLAASSPKRKAAVKHVRNLVDKLRSRGHDGLAQALEAEARQAFGRGELKRRRPQRGNRG